jgi:DNA invertase Pin-like site-specific DNA recombinase
LSLDRKTPAAQYLRVSTNLQDCSLPEQAAAIGMYANERGYTVVETYSDNARSGLTLTGRPSLQRLLADVLSSIRVFDAILVYDISRWGRFQDVDEGAHYEFLCRQCGVPVIYCAEPFENDGSPHAELVKQLKRVMAADHSRSISDRIRLGNSYGVDQGYFVGGPIAFGYVRQVVQGDGRAGAILGAREPKSLGQHVRLVPGPPGAVAVVQRIFDLLTNEGLNPRAIATRLNANSASSPGQVPWCGKAVRRLLVAQVYRGAYVRGKTETELGGPSKFMPRSNWRVIEKAWPPIISDAQFARAQDLLTGAAFGDADIDRALKRLLKRHGRLNAELLESAADLPSVPVLIQRFGSVEQLYARVGYRHRYRPARR